jgi:hypothetical protein
VNARKGKEKSTQGTRPEMTSKRTAGIILILLGMGLPLGVLPFTSAYDIKDSLFGNVLRNALSGEVIFRESVIEMVPDRDEQLFSELQEYTRTQLGPEGTPGEQIVERFYEERYRGKMPKMEFRLKLEKKKVVTHKGRIDIPYKYIVIFSLLVFFTGAGLIVFSIMRKRK